MSVKGLLVGKPLHWVMVAVAIGLLYWFGASQFHRVDYTGFLFALLGIAAACVAIVLVTYRRGDRITRQPLVEEEEASRDDA